MLPKKIIAKEIIIFLAVVFIGGCLAIGGNYCNYNNAAFYIYDDVHRTHKLQEGYTQKQTLFPKEFWLKTLHQFEYYKKKNRKPYDSPTFLAHEQIGLFILLYGYLLILLIRCILRVIINRLAGRCNQ